MRIFRTPKPSFTPSLIGAGMTVRGDITADSPLRIEGDILGTIRADQSVVIGKAGRIEGDVFASDAIVAGIVTGSIAVSGQLTLQSTAIVYGDIRAAPGNVEMAIGAKFSGHISPIEDGDTGEALDIGESIAVAKQSESRSFPASRGARDSIDANGAVVQPDSSFDSRVA